MHFWARFRRPQGSFSLSSPSIALVPQQAWIMNATLKANVLFHNDVDGARAADDAAAEEARYQGVIDDCALRSDLEILDNGDQCEIGDRGINLWWPKAAGQSCTRSV